MQGPSEHQPVVPNCPRTSPISMSLQHTGVSRILLFSNLMKMFIHLTVLFHSLTHEIGLCMTQYLTQKINGGGLQIVYGCFEGLDLALICLDPYDAFQQIFYKE